MNSILAGARLGFYNGADISVSQDHADIKSLSRFNFMAEAAQRPVMLISSIAEAAFAAIKVVFLAIRNGMIAVKESDLRTRLKQPIVNLVMIPLAVAGILFPQTINEKILRIDSNGISILTDDLVEAAKTGHLKLEVFYKDESYENLGLKFKLI